MAIQCLYVILQLFCACLAESHQCKSCLYKSPLRLQLESAITLVQIGTRRVRQRGRATVTETAAMTLTKKPATTTKKRAKLRTKASLTLKETRGRMSEAEGAETNERRRRRSEKETDSRRRRRGTFEPGEIWDVFTLVRREGILRGVTISADLETDLQSVVQFKESSLKDDSLCDKMVSNAEIENTVTFVESTSSSNVNEQNEIIDKFGTSAVKDDDPISKTFKPDGSPVSVSFGKSSSESSSSSNSRASDQQTSQKSKEYTMSKYAFEPYVVLDVKHDGLETTPEFTRSVDKLTADNGTYSMTDLFADYGTHICTRVLLGGWWRITTTVTSTEDKSVSDMSKVASDTIKAKESSEMGATFESGGESEGEGESSKNAEGEGESPEQTSKAEGHFSHSASSSESSEKTSSTEQSQDISSASTTTNTIEEWKGGTYASTPEEWREDLDLNANWKVIDRYIGDCSGIWLWVTNQEWRLKICNEWKDRYFAAVDGDASDVDDGICEGSGIMKDLWKQSQAQKSEIDTARRTPDEVGFCAGIHPDVHTNATTYTSADTTSDTKSEN